MLSEEKRCGFRWSSRAAAVFAGVVSVGLVAGAAEVATSSGARRCSLAWRLKASPAVAEASLGGIDASSRENMWVVGNAQDRSPLIEHWDGSGWRTVDTPGANGMPWKVAATSASTAWAVGGTTAALRWDGRRWLKRRLRLTAVDVAAAGGGNAWAVGARLGMPDYDQPLRVARWDGRRWHSLPPPAGMPRSLYPEAISARVGGVDGGEAWVVGRARDSRADAFALTFAARWNGSRWRYVRTPNVSLAERAVNAFFAVSGSSPTNVWAVGFWESPGDNRGGPLIERWDGHRWRVITPSPSGLPCDSRLGSCTTGDDLYGVAALAVDDVWAVGARWIDGNTSRPLVEHWDGHHWRVVRAAGTGKLEDIVALSRGNVWAVGERKSRGKQLPLILHYSCA